MGIVCIRPKRRCHTVTSCERCQLSTERLNVVDKQGFSRSAIVPTSKGATKRLNAPCLRRFHSWQKSSTQVTGTSGGTEESASLQESTTAFEHQEHSSCDAVVAPIICHSVFWRMREHRAGPSSRIRRKLSSTPPGNVNRSEFQDSSMSRRPIFARKGLPRWQSSDMHPNYGCCPQLAFVASQCVLESILQQAGS